MANYQAGSAPRIEPNGQLNALINKQLQISNLINELFIPGRCAVEIGNLWLEKTLCREAEDVVKLDRGTLGVGDVAKSQLSGISRSTMYNVTLSCSILCK